MDVRSPSLDHWYATGERLEVGPYSQFFRRGGRGRHVTLLHGFPTCSWDWSRVWPTLERSRELLAVDLLGFGASDKPAIRYTFEDQTDRITQLWSALGVQFTTVVAHDYSVTIAQELLARQAGPTAPSTNIEGVVLLNGALRGDLHRPRMIQRVLASPAGRYVAPLMSRGAFARSFRSVFSEPPSDPEIDAFWRMIQRNGGKRRAPDLLHYIEDRRARGSRWQHVLETTPTPLTFIWGMLDPVSGAHVLEGYRGLGGVLELEVGHYPHWEQPELVAARIEEVTP